MRYRLIAITGTQAVGGAAANATEAVLKLSELEQAGHQDVIIKEEGDGNVTREELLRAAEQEKRDAEDKQPEQTHAPGG